MWIEDSVQQTCVKGLDELIILYSLVCNNLLPGHSNASEVIVKVVGKIVQCIITKHMEVQTV